uniref:Uncharacterized protein n=1 Tax=Rhizophora mucronata TaxID=61149 RepID=A0A2P2PEM3_RHIMU
MLSIAVLWMVVNHESALGIVCLRF